MKLTILFFHQGALMKFRVFYSPALDNSDQEGLWNVDDNSVAMSWRMFSDFRNERDMRRRKALLDSIPKCSAYEIGKGF